MKSIYIAGPMKGHPDYHEKFSMAADVLTDRGWIVINPAVLPEGLNPEAYMPICTAMIQAADAVCMLEGWQKSYGAKLERWFASYQRKAVYTTIESVPHIVDEG